MATMHIGKRKSILTCILTFLLVFLFLLLDLEDGPEEVEGLAGLDGLGQVAVKLAQSHLPVVRRRQDAVKEHNNLGVYGSGGRQGG